MKNHNYKCSICGKSFFNENDLKCHLPAYQYERMNAKPNIFTNLSKQKKIKWTKDISCVKNIPFNNITLKGDILERFKEMF